MVETNVAAKMTFLKYNNIIIRERMSTDYYTEQSLENVHHNIEKLIMNGIKAFREVSDNGKR